MEETRERGETFAGYTRLVVESCGVCGVMFAIPEPMKNACLRDHSREFWCPNGHNVHYIGKTEAEKLREKLERETSRAGRLAAERDQARASERAQRGAATRARNERDRLNRRVAHGVCPCCGRTVKQLARHMETKHPGFVVEADNPTKQT